MVGSHGEHLINSADLGHAKLDREAFARAHRRIEERLGAAAGVPVSLRPDEVLFLDDSRRHVRGALTFGWQAVLHANSAAGG